MNDSQQVPHKGWHSRGYLPHFDSSETIQFVTFRLADSFPRAVAEALANLSDNLAETDRRLDQPAIARIVEDAMLHFDAERYRVLAWCVMPNHVHVVIEPSEGYRLGEIVHTWKSFSAKQANLELGRNGAFWHRDYFDRFVRDEGHLLRTIDYVENNPVKAGLVGSRAAWPWSSARFRT